MTGQVDPTTEIDPSHTGRSGWTRWIVVVVGGMSVLFLLVTLLSPVLKVSEPLAFVGAFALSIAAGGRAGGVRGPVEWIIAAGLIVGAAFALAYLVIFSIASQMTGP